MKKQIFILVLVILSVFFMLGGCSNEKGNSENIENADVETIKSGKYFGQPYTMTSSFMPILTLEKNNKFLLELAISNSIEGTYIINSNKLVLTSSNGAESYIFDIDKDTLVIEQEIPKLVKNNTRFKYAELKAD